MEMRVKGMEEDMNTFISTRASMAKEDKENLAKQIKGMGDSGEEYSCKPYWLVITNSMYQASGRKTAPCAAFVVICSSP